MGFLDLLLRHPFPFMYPTQEPIPTLNPIRFDSNYFMNSLYKTRARLFIRRFSFSTLNLIWCFSCYANSTAAGLVYDFIAGGDLERRKQAQDLLLQHHGHCRLLVVEVGQGALHSITYHKEQRRGKDK